MLGSALSLPDRDTTGVPGAKTMVEMVLSRLDAVQRIELSQILLGANNQYAAAMQFFRDRRGQDALNRLVFDAVLEARIDDSENWIGPMGWDVENVLMRPEPEELLNFWHVPTGLRAAGSIIAHFGKRLGETVLTTNFDPLIGVAIRKSGGHYFRVCMDDDGDIAAMGGSVSRIVHLHGYWRNSDTFHTIPQMEALRPKLDDSLKRMLLFRTILVIGYGGWDDVFTRALAAIAAEPRCGTKIVWCFHESDPQQIQKRYRSVLGSLSLAGDERLTVVAGFDANVELPKILQELVTKEVFAREVCALLVRSIRGGRGSVKARQFMKMHPLPGISYIGFVSQHYGMPQHALEQALQSMSKDENLSSEDLPGQVAGFLARGLYGDCAVLDFGKDLIQTILQGHTE